MTTRNRICSSVFGPIGRASRRPTTLASKDVLGGGSGVGGQRWHRLHTSLHSFKRKRQSYVSVSARGTQEYGHGGGCGPRWVVGSSAQTSKPTLLHGKFVRRALPSQGLSPGFLQWCRSARCFSVSSSALKDEDANRNEHHQNGGDRHGRQREEGQEKAGEETRAAAIDKAEGNYKYEQKYEFEAESDREGVDLERGPKRTETSSRHAEVVGAVKHQCKDENSSDGDRDSLRNTGMVFSSTDDRSQSQSLLDFASPAELSTPRPTETSGRRSMAKGHAKRAFVDKVRVKVAGGHGGDGCISFTMDAPGCKRPDGGDGGRGGDVVLRADRFTQALNISTHHFNAQDGKNGSGNSKRGRAGSNTVINVPCGTVVMRVDREYVYDEETGDESIRDSFVSLADMDVHEAKLVVATGGEGGVGNQRMSNKQRHQGLTQTRRKGRPGEEQFLLLELKTIADVGLVGYPNAGKSTLLSAISKAKPKVAPYPFTTLHPYVGQVEFQDHSKITVADLPGLVDGAADNVGLGHSFLRHIERTKVLVYVLDTASTEKREPWNDLKSLQKELELYAPNITSRPSIVVANKMDLETAGPRLARLRAATDLPVLPISAKHSVDIETVVRRMKRLVEDARRQEKYRK